jgi:hypothetical protein
VRLVWHIVRKDLQRFALPIVAWLVLLAIPMLVFRFRSVAIEGHVASSVDTTLGLFSIWDRLLAAVHGLLGYVIASSLVLEDPLVGTNGFWTTRPISNGRLLAAKLAGTAIMFGLLPLLVLAPIWWASGFSALEMLGGAGEFLRYSGSIVLLAAAVASLSRNLAQVLFFTIVVVGAYVGILVLATQLFSVRYRHSGELLSSTILIGMSLILVQQFLTRRPVRGWISLAGAAIAVMAIQVTRPAFLHGAAASAARPAETPEDRAAKFDVILGNFSRHPNSAPSLIVTAPWMKDGGYVPMYAVLPNGRTGRGPYGVGMMESGRRALGLSAESGSLQWQVMMPWLTGRPDAELSVMGSLELWVVRTEVVGELALAVGNEVRSGATSTRIVELGRRDDRLDEIFVEERDARARAQAEMVRHFDHYYLLDRKRNTFVSVSGHHLGAMEMNSLAVCFRRLHVAGDSDWKDGVLIRLRFARERRFSRPFEVGGTTLMNP